MGKVKLTVYEKTFAGTTIIFFKDGHIDSAT